MNNNKKNPDPKLNPDFKHRLSYHVDTATLLSLTETINTLALQAESSLRLLSFQFSDAEADRASDDIIYWSIMAAINTVKDIDEVVKAYHEAHKTTDSEVAA
ncbi:hypothetical protein [Methylobacter sp.]|uniref:hypothetical protein n=1 Tax=Methylobacter sp. TaxID=2051955 RepID=UPI00248771FC|nr:hypothetical protein [Methylobacter sp.]MDI1277282.1 hypothetical protein [Methylobacter sp.]MDI1357848.1 hypothetical protein [Methylobacter sp.]